MGCRIRWPTRSSSFIFAGDDDVAKNTAEFAGLATLVTSPLVTHSLFPRGIEHSWRIRGEDQENIRSLLASKGLGIRYMGLLHDIDKRKMIAILFFTDSPIVRIHGVRGREDRNVANFSLYFSCGNAVVVVYESPWWEGTLVAQWATCVNTTADDVCQHHSWCLGSIFEFLWTIYHL